MKNATVKMETIILILITMKRNVNAIPTANLDVMKIVDAEIPNVIVQNIANSVAMSFACAKHVHVQMHVKMGVMRIVCAKPSVNVPLNARKDVMPSASVFLKTILLTFKIQPKTLSAKIARKIVKEAVTQKMTVNAKISATNV